MKLPPKVTEKHGRYYLLAQSTERSAGGRLKRRWVPLSRVDQGPAALYEAIAAVHRAPSTSAMPAIIQAWRTAALPGYAVKTRMEYERMCAVLAKGFEAFDIADVRPTDVADFVDQWADRPRAGNAYRALLGTIMSYAVRRGHRDDNPVREISGHPITARSRYITDDELAAIKAHCSPMTAVLVDLALVTGQRIGDLLALKWADVKPAGIVFRPAKVRGSSGAAVPIRMTPRLASVIARAKTATKVSGLWVICTRRGQPLTYHGAHSAWRRACIAAGVEGAHFHDLRRRALTDAKRQGLDPRRLGGHTTDGMTQRYIEAAGLDWIDPPEAQSVDTGGTA